jgi:hypothetical protein
MGFTEDQVREADLQAERTMGVLVRIGQVWGLAKEWIEVLDTAKNIMTRGEGRRVKRSRYDYPELEDSIHLAPLQGMPRQTFDARTSTSVNAAGDDVSKLHQLVAGDVEQGAEVQESGLNDEMVGGSEFVDEDWWRLLSFCDDPHLLSTSIDNAGEENLS